VVAAEAPLFHELVRAVELDHGVRLNARFLEERGKGGGREGGREGGKT